MPPSAFATFPRIAILGTGLIGGSFALAVRKEVPAARIAGWDRPETLARAKAVGAIDESTDTLASVSYTHLDVYKRQGVATAAVAALLELDCIVYMGTEDMKRQALNVARMNMLGTKVVGVDTGSRTLKDAISEALRDWVTNVRDTYYLLGSALGPHPYPCLLYTSLIGKSRMI